MKRYSKIIGILALVSLDAVSGVSAQEHVQALRDKCSENKAIPQVSITRQDSKTGKKYVTLRFTIKNNPTLIGEFLDAFTKDESLARKVTIQRRGDEMIRQLEFHKDGMPVWYYLSQKGAANGEMIYSEGMIEKTALGVVPKLPEQSKVSKTVKMADDSVNVLKNAVYRIPKGSKMSIDGVWVTAEQARALGLDVYEY